MAKCNSSVAVARKQLRWIKRHKVGIGSLVRIIRVPSDDELNGFPAFNTDVIRQFRRVSWGHVFLIEERSITIRFDNGCDEYVDVPYFILDDAGIGENKTATAYIRELNKRIEDFLGRKVLVTRKARHGEEG